MASKFNCPDRRLVIRWEYDIENFLGFVQLACLLMLLRYL